MRARWFVLVFGVVGCGDSGSATDPKSGTWTYTSAGTPSDSCGIVPLLGLDNGTFELVNNGDGTLTIDDGDWVFDCTLEGSDFDCPDRFPGGYSTSGTEIAVDGTASGTFSTGEDATATQQGTADCEDALCTAALGLMGVTPPCDVEVQSTLEFGT
jgi:hypothetical protein